jgi:putative DNA primase/helicase
MAHDINEIKSRLKLSELIGSSVQLQADGKEFKGLCPFHSERTPSFTVSDRKGFYHCYGCNAHGDVIDWCQHGLRMEKGDAIAYAASLAGLGEYTGAKPTAAPVQALPVTDEDGQADDWQPILPVPEDAPPLMVGNRTTVIWNIKRSKESQYTPTMAFPFKDAAGALLGYVIRYEIDGKKLTPQITYCEGPDGQRRWCVRHFNEPRPLYGLDRLAAKPKAPVVLVEGEKKADTIERLMPAAVGVSWPGGSKGLSKVDWSPLQGRQVIMWPDADVPGEQAAWGYMSHGRMMPGIQQKIGTACNLVIIDPPEGVAKGWDVADAEKDGWTAQQVQQFMKDAYDAAKLRGVKAPVPDPKAPAPQEPTPQPPEPVHDAPDYDPNAYDLGPPDYDVHLRAPYRALGHYRGVFFYMPTRSRQVLELTAMSHRELNMMQLAPLDYWESTFPARGGQSKVDWKLAADACMRACYERGFFDANTQLRGRGAWLDRGRSVLHLGETLVVDGVKIPPHIIDSRFTYQADHSLEIVEAPPLTTSEANRLVQITKRLSWENPISGLLLAGLCVIAPVCGILPWRPHAWLTGGSGSGKSTILNHLIKPIIGLIALNVTSNTTESGIRQSLKSDARPVIFDEAESEDKAQAMRVQSILDLCRAASAEDGAKVIKGSAGHDAMSFHIRSCFVFSSINTAVKHFADERRVTMLVLRSPNADADTPEIKAVKAAEFNAIKADMVRTFTEEFSAGLLMRTLQHLPTLRANIGTFVDAGSVVLGSRAAADQLAPMLAGAYLLHSTKLITYDEAVAWMRENDLREMSAASNAIDDENRLMQFLMSLRLKVQTTVSMADRTVGELIETVARGSMEVCGVSPSNADSELRRFGIKVDGLDGFWVSTSSTDIKRALSDTPWAANWARPMRMLKGARAEKDPVRFSPGNRTRAVYIPINYVLGT